MSGAGAPVLAQTGAIWGHVALADSDLPLAEAQVFLKDTPIRTSTNEYGRFLLEQVPYGEYLLVVYMTDEYLYDTQRIALHSDSLRIQVRVQEPEVAALRISGTVGEYGPLNLRPVEGAALYAGKKTEVVTLEESRMNLATNNARQAFARVPGLNIWESEGAGVQLGIGTRGLSPSRTANFNTRQNGYDIAADALGYPESYYTPPLPALERVEVVRGAAALQYGPQFGGMLNFRFRAPANAPIAVRLSQSGGSFGFAATYAELSGQKGDFRYRTFYQYRRADGWRPNSGFDQHTAHALLGWQPTPKLQLSAEYTGMHYLAQQPGGLTDTQFEEDPRKSTRERNWFRVNWHLMALKAQFRPTPRTALDVHAFGLVAGRASLGVLDRADRADPGGPRDLLLDAYQNVGGEARVLHRYAIRSKTMIIAGGIRLYRGFTDRQQGVGNANSTGHRDDFSFPRTDSIRYAAYQFPGLNAAGYAEHMFFLTNKLSITPGIRVEWISTDGRGSYNDLRTDQAGNPLFFQTVPDSFPANRRAFALVGVGASYKPKPTVELYANWTQNYRAVTFSDIIVVNPNQRVDSALTDERGYSADLGLRGQLRQGFDYDVSLFALRYDDRIGQVLRVDSATFNTFRFRTNVSDARTLGIEAYLAWDIARAFQWKTDWSLRPWVNIALQDGQYINTDDPAVRGNRVELVPQVLLRTGVQFRWQQLRVSAQFNHTGTQFSDATNAEETPSAIEGRIPAYSILDLTASYTWRWFTLSTTLNNLANTGYFTRRAAGYPGPGILPGDGRAVYATLSFRY